MTSGEYDSASLWVVVRWSYHYTVSSAGLVLVQAPELHTPCNRDTFDRFGGRLIWPKPVSAVWVLRPRTRG